MIKQRELQHLQLAKAMILAGIHKDLIIKAVSITDYQFQKIQRDLQVS
jgi:hypothetical protein